MTRKGRAIKAGGAKADTKGHATGTATSLDAVFDGTCEIEIADSQTAPPRREYPLRCHVTFSEGRDRVTIREFVPIETGPFEARVGLLSVTSSTTVHMRTSSSGALSADGHFSIDVVLHFDHSFDAPFIEEDSDLPITLSTRGRGGAPLRPDGSAVLVGEGRFTGGTLDGKRCRLDYRGRVDPVPR